MQIQESRQMTAKTFIHGATRNAHRRYISLVCLLLCGYVLSFLLFQWRSLLAGSSDFILNIGFLALAVRNLYRQRQTLLSYHALMDDRLLGYGLMLGGGLFFLAIRIWSDSISLQALAAMLMVLGIAMSTWGLAFFTRFWQSTLLILTAIYPSIGFVAIRFFRFFTSEDALEQLMAHLGSTGLNFFWGFNSVVKGILVTFPEGSVEVGPGCSGFDMALSTVGIAFLIGQFMNASWKRTASIMFVGWALAMLFNIPRIMLLAIAAVYWGQQSFDFWHGPIGGQIFSGILFTVYYYIAMWLLEYKLDKSDAT